MSEERTHISLVFKKEGVRVTAEDAAVLTLVLGACGCYAQWESPTEIRLYRHDNDAGALAAAVEWFLDRGWRAEGGV